MSFLYWFTALGSFCCFLDGCFENQTALGHACMISGAMGGGCSHISIAIDEASKKKRVDPGGS